MKRVELTELRELPDDELLARLEEFKEELFNLRFQSATGQLDNPMRVKQVRHDVARIMTLLRGRQTEEELMQAVARADRMRSSNRQVMSGARLVKLCARRPRHARWPGSRAAA